VGRLSTASNPASVAALLLGALTVMFGLQLLRMLFVGMAVYLSQVQGVSPILVGGVGLAVFLCGLLAPAVRRTLGPRNAPWVVIGSLGVIWLAEKAVSSLAVDLGLSIAGALLFLWSLPLLLRSRRPGGGHGSAAHVVVAILLGLSADTAVKGVFGTVELSWAQGAAGYAVASCLLAGHGVLLWRLSRDPPRGPKCSPADPTWTYLAIGPALALQLLLFQNIAQQTVLIGWPQPAVHAWILASNLAAVAVAVELTRRGRRAPRPMLALLGTLLVATVAVEWSGVLAALAAMAGQILIAVALVSVVTGARASPAAPAAAPAADPADERAGASASTWMGMGMVALLALLFIYYANYSTDILVPREVVRPLAAVLIGLAALRAGFAAGAVRTPVTRAAVVPALLLLILPLIHLTTWQDVQPTAGEGFPVRVMTYNVHQGFDVDGRHAIERMAQVIEAESPDIVALQEVSRGWVVNGSVDMLVWLSQRLGMDYVWGPAADSVWGNAVLSRFPIIAFENHAMPNNDVIRLDRGFLTARVDLGGGEVLDVVSTHFHAGAADSALRIPQALAVLEVIDPERTTVLIGDLNAPPGDPELLLLEQAGLQDAFVVAGATGEGLTYRADRPRRRIDYVWLSPDLRARDFSTHPSLASDHLAVAATIFR
jgi:endonuclease/exonuclease/phosphatase family metal-dependent hydrolase